MLLAYLDESYNQTHYWIAALIVPDTAVAQLTNALDQVVLDAAAKHGTDWNAELHGYDLFHREGDWEDVYPRIRIGVYQQATTAIAAHPVDIIVRGVKPARLKERYANPFPPHEIVLEHLLERIDERSENHYESEPVLVIADEIDQAATYRHRLWMFQRAATRGYRSRQITHIVDTIHFAPSYASRLVQAADLIAFLYQRYHARRQWGFPDASDKAMRVLWERLLPRVHHHHCWWP